MSEATTIYRNRIALVFDFDETLAPDTYSAILSDMGYDSEPFLSERVDPLLAEGWDEILAKYYTLIEASRESDRPITRERLRQLGQQHPLYDGVEEMFEQVEQWAKEVKEDVEVEFYLLTSGMLEIPRATALASRFQETWGGAFHFNERDEIEAVKRVVTHPQKVRYLMQLAKGLGTDGPDSPADVYRDVPLDEYYIPFDQILYLGDGASDMPAFSLMFEEGGSAIGIVENGEVGEWKGYKKAHRRRRVENLAPLDYSEGSELMRSIRHGVESVCKEISLRTFNRGE